MIHRRFVLLLVVFTFAASTAGAIIALSTDNSSALAKKWFGYFWGEKRAAGDKSYGRVLQAGIPDTNGQSEAAIKSQFIDYILGKYGDNTAIDTQDSVGAAYIIQTMRGGTDTGAPDASDIADWKQRINNPDVDVGWGLRDTTENSGHIINKSGKHDVMRLDGDGSDWWSLVFSISGAEVYVVKQICANPLGALGGLPEAPPKDYYLYPSVEVSRPDGEPGQPVVVTVKVNNTGHATSSDTSWQLSRFVAPAGYVYAGDGTSANGPEVYYGNNVTQLDGDGGTNKASYKPGNLPVGAPTHILPDVPVGSRVCYAFSVHARAHDDAQWAHSPPACVIITKKPKVQILGGDLFVGKGAMTVSLVQTSTITKSVNGTDRTFGSWGEYAIAASGVITGMASGAGYSGGSTSAAFCNASLLTFSNATNADCSESGTKGNYVTNKPLPNISSRFTESEPLGANPTFNATNAPKGVYNATGSVSLVTSGDIAKGKWVVINAPTATVTIKNNITYTNAPLVSNAEIPQVIIIANNINIEAGVSRVDAWLIAAGGNGVINTCSEITVANQLHAGKCTTQLTVNGPVMAKQLLMYRTAGAGVGADAGTAAEIFNLRPDAYLWATGYVSAAGRLQTVSTKELPPRF